MQTHYDASKKMAWSKRQKKHEEARSASCSSSATMEKCKASERQQNTMKDHANNEKKGNKRTHNALAFETQIGTAGSRKRQTIVKEGCTHTSTHVQLTYHILGAGLANGLLHCVQRSMPSCTYEYGQATPAEKGKRSAKV